MFTEASDNSIEDLGQTDSDSSEVTQSGAPDAGEFGVDHSHETSGDAGQSGEQAGGEGADTSAGEADSLITDAVSIYGMTEDEAAEFGDALPAVLARLDRQAAQLMREQMQAGQEKEPPAREEQSRQEPAKEPAKEPAAETSPITELPKFELKLERDNYDDGTLGAFDSLAEEINRGRELVNRQTEALRQMAQLLVETHQTTSKVAEQTQSESEVARNNELDAIFAGLGSEFHETFGTKPLHEMQAGPQVDARNALLEEMHLLELADRQRGQTAPRAQYARRALAVLHQDKVVAAARKGVQQQLTNHRRRGIAPPTGSKNKSATGRERALAVIAKYKSDMGL